MLKFNLGIPKVASNDNCYLYGKGQDRDKGTGDNVGVETGDLTCHLRDTRRLL
jgi:hypothetical protein